MPIRKKPIASGPRSAGYLQQKIDELVEREVRGALREHEGNVTHAAKALGLSRRALWDRMLAMGVDPASYRK